MKCPNLKKPRKPISINGQWIPFNRVLINETPYYLPRGLSWHPSGMFRVFIRDEVIYVYRRSGTSFEEYLSEAWDRWESQKWKDSRPRGKHGPQRKIETGCRGVMITISIRNKDLNKIFVDVGVNETIDGKGRRIHISSKAIENITQPWLDEALKRAIAVRRTYEDRKNENLGISVLVRGHDFDPNCWPSVLPRKVFVREVKDRVTEILEERKSQQR